MTNANRDVQAQYQPTLKLYNPLTHQPLTSETCQLAYAGNERQSSEVAESVHEQKGSGAHLQPIPTSHNPPPPTLPQALCGTGLPSLSATYQWRRQHQSVCRNCKEACGLVINLEEHATDVSLELAGIQRSVVHTVHWLPLRCGCNSIGNTDKLRVPVSLSVSVTSSKSEKAMLQLHTVLCEVQCMPSYVASAYTQIHAKHRYVSYPQVTMHDGVM